MLFGSRNEDSNKFSPLETPNLDRKIFLQSSHEFHKNGVRALFME